jgi:sensor histidine kinase regulating citrate/malate metabolism
MVENILKNALEAILEKGAHGNIRIDLSEGKLTLANNGGAIVKCIDCQDSCLNCRKYGHPGQTSKAERTGHGLAQVFGTCRRNGWDLKMKASGDWTIIEINLRKEGSLRTLS